MPAGVGGRSRGGWGSARRRLSPVALCLRRGVLTSVCLTVARIPETAENPAHTARLARLPGLPRVSDARFALAACKTLASKAPSPGVVLAQRCSLIVVRCVQQLFASVRAGSTGETVRVSIRKA